MIALGDRPKYRPHRVPGAYAKTREAHVMAAAIIRRAEKSPNGCIGVFYDAGGVVMAFFGSERYGLQSEKRQLLGVYSEDCPLDWLITDLLWSGLAT